MAGTWPGHPVKIMRWSLAAVTRPACPAMRLATESAAGPVHRRHPDRAHPGCGP